MVFGSLVTLQSSWELCSCSGTLYMYMHRYSGYIYMYWHVINLTLVQHTRTSGLVETCSSARAAGSNSVHRSTLPSPTPAVAQKLESVRAAGSWSVRVYSVLHTSSRCRLSLLKVARGSLGHAETVAVGWEVAPSAREILSTRSEISCCAIAAQRVMRSTLTNDQKSKQKMWEYPITQVCTVAPYYYY